MDAKQREAKLGNLREWSLASLAQNKPTFKSSFILVKLINPSQIKQLKVKQPLAKFATAWNLSQVVDDVKFWMLYVQWKCRRI